MGKSPDIGRRGEAGQPGEVPRPGGDGSFRPGGPQPKIEGVDVRRTTDKPGEARGSRPSPVDGQPEITGVALPRRRRRPGSDVPTAPSPETTGVDTTRSSRTRRAIDLPTVARVVAPDPDKRRGDLERTKKRGRGHDAELAAGALNADRLPPPPPRVPGFIQRAMGVPLDALHATVRQITTVANVGRPAHEQVASQLAADRADSSTRRRLRRIGRKVLAEEKEAAQQAADAAKKREG